MDLGDIVHIGDEWVSDVLGAVRAGCQAIYLDATRGKNAAPPREDWPTVVTERIGVAHDLVDAIPIVAELAA